MRTLLLLLIAATAAAQTPDYERILVPVFFQGAGAFGSSWTTTVAIANTGSTPLRFSQPLLEGNPACAAICGCGQSDRVDAQTVNRVCILNPNPAGLILYRDRSSGDSVDVHFGARIADVSRSSETAGTELRIVREGELRQGRIVLPDIPTGANHRVALRVFDARPFPGISVTMRIHDRSDLLTSIGEAAVPLTLPSDASHPSFGMVPDLAAAFPQIAAHGFVSIELLLPEPLISPPRPPAYWAVASITNNATQQVTMVTPQ